jgi:hypothetical protein
LEVSSPIAFTESTVAFSGQLTPAKQGENVTIYVGAAGSTWQVAGTAVTQADGRFEYAWLSETLGVYAVRASWAGDDSYRSSVSTAGNVVVVPPFFLVALIVVAVVVAVLGAVAFFSLKRAKQRAMLSEESGLMLFWKCGS